MKVIKRPPQYTAVAIIFLILGATAALLLIVYVRGPSISFGSGEDKRVVLPGSGELISRSVPQAIYTIITGIIFLLTTLYFIEGYLLLKNKKAGYNLGIILSIFLLFSIPLGTILGITNLILLIKYNPHKKRATQKKVLTKRKT